MKKYEYRIVDSQVYKKCLNMTNELLKKISTHYGISVAKLFPKHIILYFESNYDINFSFFESTPNESIVNRTSGLTMPKEARTLIFINQSMPLTRITFTILHELAHLHFHRLEDNKTVFTSKFSGKYTEEILPFEDEANIIASLLFCSTPKLEILLTRNYSFDKIRVISGMSTKGLHTRLLNYLHHILGLSNNKSLEIVLKFKDNDYKTKNQIKYLINKKNNIFKPTRTISIKTSHGTIADQQTCITFLQKLSLNELVSELEYARYTKNQTLELLVMNEYYNKQQK